MAVNKVIYNQRTLIDLTEDTVTEATLTKGFTAHQSDGTIITGKLFDGHPEEHCLRESMNDSNGEGVVDGSGNVIRGRIVYRRV